MRGEGRRARVVREKEGGNFTQIKPNPTHFAMAGMILDTRYLGTMCGRRLLYVATTTAHRAMTSSQNSLLGAPQVTQRPAREKLKFTAFPSFLLAPDDGPSLCSVWRGASLECEAPPTSSLVLPVFSKSSGTGVNVSLPATRFRPAESSKGEDASSEPKDSMVACRCREGFCALLPGGSINMGQL
jgi:hypothetical protein